MRDGGGGQRLGAGAVREARGSDGRGREGGGRRCPQGRRNGEMGGGWDAFPLILTTKRRAAERSSRSVGIAAGPSPTGV